MFNYDDFNSNPWVQLLAWTMVGLAALVMMGFITVVEAQTQRGELRRENQRMTGALLLPDERDTQVATTGADILLTLQTPLDQVASR